MGLAFVDGAAAVVAVRLAVSDVFFEGAFLYGDTASAGVVVVNGWEHDGLLFERDRIALVAGRVAALDAMFMLVIPSM